MILHTGVHKGKSLDQVPVSYLTWILECRGHSEGLRRAAKFAILRRIPSNVKDSMNPERLEDYWESVVSADETIPLHLLEKSFQKLRLDRESLLFLQKEVAKRLKELAKTPVKKPKTSS